MGRREIDISGLTKQRKAVLSVVRDAGEHLTANDVFMRARVILPSISFATVYNSLRFLKDEGLLKEIHLGGGPVQYDKLTSRHDHAICDSCGRVVDLHLEIPNSVTAAAENASGFRTKSFELILRGLCSDCRE
ncbi:MAG: Fur family transcriptional regulator [Pyrinomonadaceae bacterium]